MTAFVDDFDALQMMVAVFDFPEWSTGDDDQLVPELVVDAIRGG